MLTGLRLFTSVVILFNIVLYRQTGITQCSDFVTISWIDSPRIIALSFLKSSVISTFFMDFLDKSKGVSLADVCI